MKHGIAANIITLFILFTWSDIPAQNPVSFNSESGLVNLNPDPSGEPWVAGGITFEEWDNNLPAIGQVHLFKTTATDTPPSKIDNSTHSAFRPVFNQKGGSCAQASGIGYQFTYELNVLRQLPSNVLKNQYPYDFTYNFLNAGSGSRGSNSTDGWTIVKALGIPDAETYGGFGQGTYTRWLSGYDSYYTGMKNRLDSYFSIKIRTAADILKMKQFLFDHSNGSQAGGVLNFAADVTEEKLVSLVSGTPEAGKRAVISFGTSGGHAMTIAGYNDSVRYDYNRDGRYTNDIDLNGDGVLDVRDWEIGAAYMVNSWGSSWGSGGKAYLMYKVLADDKSVGGIWSNSVTGITITNAQVEPKLTYKVKMTFNPRSALKIRAGYSTTASATTPTATKTFGKAFNLAGGTFPMLGSSNDPIEFGLDVSDFIPKLTTNEYALFLQIETSSGSGSVEQFSVIDYSSGQAVETVCQDKNIAIATGTTRLKVVKTTAPLLVVSPNGGEKWERGRTFTVTWSTRDTAPVAIELLKNGTFLSTISASAPATGAYSWSIPSTLTPGTDYSIRISNTVKTSYTDVSDKIFSIEDLSELKLVTPSSTQYLVKGTSAPITWTTNVSGLLRIDLYRHGVFEKRIDSVQASSNTFTWQIPNDVPGGFDFRIRITSKDKDWLYDESDTDLGIGYPVVKAPYMQSFDSFTLGENMSGNWEQLLEDDINWTIMKGTTPSKVHPQGGGTGPNGDHTTKSGIYLYVEASTPNNPGKEAILLSPVFDISGAPGAQVSFWCHMFSREKRMGQMWIDVYADGKWNDSVLYLTGDHGDQWFLQTIDLAKFGSSQVQLRFRVLTGTDYDSDICIDDISISGSTIVSRSRLISNVPAVSLFNNSLTLRGYSGVAIIYTLDGKILLKKSILSNIENIDISNLSRGTYLLDINKTTRSFVRK